MVRVRVFQAKFSKKFACLQFKFIKENLGWTSLNLLNFISHFLSKKCFLSACEILGFARFLAGLCHLALLYRSCKRYENFSRNSFVANFFITKQPRIDSITLCNQAKYPQDAPQQKLSILLLKSRHSIICRRISSFDKISIKSSKKVVCSPLQ